MSISDLTEPSLRGTAKLKNRLWCACVCVGGGGGEGGGGGISGVHTLSKCKIIQDRVQIMTVCVLINLNRSRDKLKEIAPNNK